MRFNLGRGRNAEHDLAAALDVGLDDLGIGASAHYDGEPDEVRSLLTVAQSLNASTPLSRNGRGLSPPPWASVVRQAGAFPADARYRLVPRRRRIGQGSRFGEFATAAVVFAVVAAGVFGTGVIERGRRQASEPVEASAMYLASSETSTDVRPIDPITLQDMPGTFPGMSATPGTVSDTDITQWAISADGSTLANRTSNDGSGQVRVLDAVTGRLERRIDAAPGTLFLSQDGSTLVVEGNTVSDDRGAFRLPTQWVAYDVATGDRLSSIEATGARRVVFTSALFEAHSDRMHILTFTDTWDMRSTEPSDLRILTYNLRTGRLVDELSLADHDLGVRLSDSSGRIESAVGWAISPNGSQIAIVPANQTGVRLIDTAGMTLSGDPIALDPIVAVGTPGPVPGECAGAAQTSLAVFGPDGRSLYASMLGYECIDGKGVQYRTSGVRAVDIETRRERPSETTTGWYVPTSQAGTGSVYAVHVELPDADDLRSMGDLNVITPAQLTLVRLDAGSLAIEAERPLDDDFMVALVVA